MYRNFLSVYLSIDLSITLAYNIIIVFIPNLSFCARTSKKTCLFTLSIQYAKIETSYLFLDISVTFMQSLQTILCVLFKFFMI